VSALFQPRRSSARERIALLPAVHGLSGAISEALPALPASADESAIRLCALALDVNRALRGGAAATMAESGVSASSLLSALTDNKQRRLVLNTASSSEGVLLQLRGDLLRVLGALAEAVEGGSLISPIMTVAELLVRDEAADAFAGTSKSESLTWIEEVLQVQSLPALAVSVVESLNEQVM
jgi:hypothetical protein